MKPSLLSRIVDAWLGVKRDLGPTLATPSQPAPLSCLAQGLIASLKSEPETWTRHHGYGWRDGVIQRQSGTTLTLWNRLLVATGPRTLYLSVGDHSPVLSDADQEALRPIVEARVAVLGKEEREYRDKAAQADAARAAAKAQPTIARFEQLGCPPPL